MLAWDVVIAANGPGELSGWVRPVARQLRRLGGLAVRLTLVLAPSQFASGREGDVVQQWGLFDRTIGARPALRLPLGLAALPVGSHGAVIHLGGDLWFSAQLAHRLHLPACALAETPLVARRHRRFTRILAVSSAVADELISLGVPPAKVVVCGDPRIDAIMEGLDISPQWNERSPTTDDRATPSNHVISFLPGSRDQFFAVLTPYFLAAAAAVTQDRRDVTCQIIVSPFVSPQVLAAVRADAARQWPHLRPTWIASAPWPALANSDLAITIPGTNTLELALAGIPFAVVVPVDRFHLAPLEGAAEWLARLPGLGRRVKRAVLARHLTRQRFVALPNLRANEALVPEWIGEWSPQDLAARITALLDDEAARAAIVAGLRAHRPDGSGASAIIAAELQALAHRVPEGVA